MKVITFLRHSKSSWDYDIQDMHRPLSSVGIEKIKKIYDTWIFSRDTTSANPNWQLVNILT